VTKYLIDDYCCWQLTSDQLFDVYKGFVEKYPVVSIEDAFDQDDWPAWTKMNAAVQIQLVGQVVFTCSVCWWTPVFNWRVTPSEIVFIYYAYNVAQLHNQHSHVILQLHT